MDERALERLIIDNPAFDALAAAMDVFCPFDSVGMADQEVKHGRFLQYILDPARPHGFGAECLRAFMRSVAGTLADAGLGFAPLDVHLMELDTAVVHRERDAIDLLIEVAPERLIVAIELKINASEHSGQLGRYRRIVERDWPGHKHLLLFLTKRGDAPSADGAGWRALSLAPVADALATVAAKQIGDPAARMMLAGYVGMLRREHLTDDRLETLAAGLWREHREALEFLMERRPDTKYALLAHLLERRLEAAERLSSETGLTVVPAHSTKSVVRFSILEWDSYPGMLTGSLSWKPSTQMLLIEVITDNAGVTRAQFTLGSGDTRDQLYERMKQTGANVGGGWALGKTSKQLAVEKVKVDEQQTTDDKLDSVISTLAELINKNAGPYAEALAMLTSDASHVAP